MLNSGDILDGYTLIRCIGQGGFGEVWLCRSDAIGDYRALKFIAAANGSALDKEYEALVRYRREAARLRSPSLTPIEHVNRREGGLFYIMPLADGGGAGSPESPDWHPRTLTTEIAAHRESPAWFTSTEIIGIFASVLAGLQTLTDAGLVHRDIKPDNILFFGGKSCLGDISLMTDDRTRITRLGTPGYSTPSWFTGGHHDMYGAAATLYTLLTGNEPDRMGRSAFMWPPQGEQSLSEPERAEWRRLHGVVRRAIAENPSERFIDFAAMQNAVTGENNSAVKVTKNGQPLSWRNAALAGIVAVTGGVIAWQNNLFATKQPGTEKAPEEHAALMKRLVPLLEENDRIGHDYDRRLNELLGFYEKTAPVALAALEALTTGSPSPADFERRLISAAPKLNALVRPELSMRDDPRIPLPREEWLRRITAARATKKAGQPEEITTLGDAQADARMLWDNVFEAAGQCPQNPAEQFWFEKRVSSRFYASPLRVTRDLPPMEIIWLTKADKGGVMRPLANGRLRELLEQARLFANHPKEAAWPGEASQRIETNLEELMKAALWVEIQVGVFMKRDRPTAR